MLPRLLTVLIALALAGAIALPHAHADVTADVAVEVIEDLEPDPGVILAPAPAARPRSVLRTSADRPVLPPHPPASPPPVPPPER